MDVINLKEEVERKANENFHELILLLLSEEQRPQFLVCLKCGYLLSNYIYRKLTLGRIDRRYHQDFPGVSWDDYRTAELKLEEARSLFYLTPCSCGARQTERWNKL